MKRILSLFSLLAMIFSASAQVAPNRYWVQFTDKNDSQYSVSRPEEFLSQRAIERRAKYNIAVDELDIPVNQSYIDAVAGCGAEILNPSKWLNGVTIRTFDESILDDINALEFVSEVRACVDEPVKKEIKDKFYFENIRYEIEGRNICDNYYGYAYPQINQLNGIAVHQAGFTGEGVLIGICDGGFAGADNIAVFAAARDEGRLLGTRDFVHGGIDVFNESAHGTAVWGLIGGKIENTYVGTAPDAMFYLCRTEDVGTENVIEEYNWVSGVELLDSIGADIMNSSLGYITFDDPLMNHTYNEMDGATCVITIGAEIACSRGILVVNSAGNEGTEYNEWRWMGAPADGAHVLTVGAVDANGVRAEFSSIGPTYDNRIKPDIMAHGKEVYVAGSTDWFGPGNGTSFSSPVLCGMTACLMQAMPQKTPDEIKDCIRMAGNKAANPDSFYGYGVPDYMEALNLLSVKETEVVPNICMKIYPNPSDGVIFVDFDVEGDKNIQVFNVLGNMIYNVDIQDDNSKIQDFMSALPSGAYFVKMTSENKNETLKVIKN
ncbi:MAG: S8 family serine peptidase [Bacteroidales bacterium]|nr:S8 family serine peptidase [Bacteroidales bacterium]